MRGQVANASRNGAGYAMDWRAAGPLSKSSPLFSSSRRISSTLRHTIELARVKARIKALVEKTVSIGCTGRRVWRRPRSSAACLMRSAVPPGRDISDPGRKRTLPQPLGNAISHLSPLAVVKVTVRSPLGCYAGLGDAMRHGRGERTGFAGADAGQDENRAILRGGSRQNLGKAGKGELALTSVPLRGASVGTRRPFVGSKHLQLAQEAHLGHLWRPRFPCPLDLAAYRADHSSSGASAIPSCSRIAVRDQPTT